MPSLLVGHGGLPGSGKRETDWGKGLRECGYAFRNAVRPACLEHPAHLLGGAIAPATGADQAREDQPRVEQDLVALVLLALADQEKALGGVAKDLALVGLELRRF